MHLEPTSGLSKGNSTVEQKWSIADTESIHISSSEILSALIFAARAVLVELPLAKIGNAPRLRKAGVRAGSRRIPMPDPEREGLSRQSADDERPRVQLS